MSIVISGADVFLPGIHGLDSLAHALRQGTSTLDYWRRPTGPHELVRIGGDASGEEPDLPDSAARLTRSLGTLGRQGVMTVLNAWRSSELKTRHPPGRIGLVVASHAVRDSYVMQTMIDYDQENALDPLFAFRFVNTDIASVISELLDIRGPSQTVSAACASGNIALHVARLYLETGRADAVVIAAPATDYSRLLLHGWAIMDGINVDRYQDEPIRTSRPFDRDRHGFIASHGSACLIVERTAPRPLAHILGIEIGCGANRGSEPNNDAQVRVMKKVLAAARLDIEDVSAIAAHATSTQVGDRTEIEALRNVFGNRLSRIPVNAAKSMFGHCTTSSATIQTVIALLEMRLKFLHPTINLDNPEFAGDFVAHEARDWTPGPVLSNAFGFGGTYSTALIAPANWV